MNKEERDNLIEDLKLRIHLEGDPQHRLQLRSALRKLEETRLILLHLGAEQVLGGAR